MGVRDRNQGFGKISGAYLGVGRCREGPSLANRRRWKLNLRRGCVLCKNKSTGRGNVGELLSITVGREKGKSGAHWGGDRKKSLEQTPHLMGGVFANSLAGEKMASKEGRRGKISK